MKTGGSRTADVVRRKNEAEAAVVRDVYKQYARGEGLRAIGHAPKRQGLPITARTAGASVRVGALNYPVAARTTARSGRGARSDSARAPRLS